MHHYRQAIILFGIVLPAIAGAGLVGVGFYAKSTMEASLNSKMTNYTTYEQSRHAGLEIEATVNRQRPHVERWTKQLAEETSSVVTSNLREISEHLPPKEIQMTAFERPSSAGGFGSISAQRSSQIRIAFRGTYRTLQRNFLELETRMPQLQLQEFKIDPSTGISPLLNCQVTYTAWEN
ncbi:MAG: hypothetical protein ABIT37_22860 [Luteolibacter sp.]